VPDTPDAATQAIDVRDLAHWIVTSAAQRITGTFNLVGNVVPLRAVLSSASVAAGYSGHVVPVDSTWLVDHGVAPWSGENSLPLWIPEGSGFAGFALRSSARAEQMGLQRRSLVETMTATLAYERGRGVDRPRGAGLNAAFEARLLEQWRL
jgi:hypothetical protein